MTMPYDSREEGKRDIIGKSLFWLVGENEAVPLNRSVWPRLSTITEMLNTLWTGPPRLPHTPMYLPPPIVTFGYEMRGENKSCVKREYGQTN